MPGPSRSLVAAVLVLAQQVEVLAGAVQGLAVAAPTEPGPAPEGTPCGGIPEGLIAVVRDAVRGRDGDTRMDREDAIEVITTIREWDDEQRCGDRWDAVGEPCTEPKGHAADGTWHRSRTGSWAPARVRRPEVDR